MLTKNQINRFLSDPDYLALSEIEREQRLLFITELSETRVSAFLAWLFKPYEGHGLGERPVRELLINTWRKAEKRPSYKVPTPGEMQRYSFSDLIVETEYQVVPGRGRGRGRCVDLLLISRQNSLVICVENKFGSTVHDDQLKTYRTELNKKFPDFRQVFVYLDWNDENEPDDDFWIQLDYAWLVTLIQSQEDAGLLSDRALHALRQVREYLSEDAATGDQASSRRERLIEGVVLRHPEVIESFRKMRRVSKYLRLESMEKSIAEPLMIEFQQRQRLWIDVLSMSHHMEIISAARQKFGNELEINSSTAGAYFRLSRWSEKEVDKEGLWGAQVWAWSGRSGEGTYVVGSGMQFANISPELETSLRTVAQKLRDPQMKASSASASWVRFHRITNQSAAEAAQQVISELLRLDVDLSAN